MKWIPFVTLAVHQNSMKSSVLQSRSILLISL